MKNSNRNYIIAILCLCLIASTFGSGVFSISLGGVQLSIFRLLLIICTGLLLIRPFYPNTSDYIIPRGGKKNKFSIAVFILWLVWAIISVFWSNDITAWFKAVFFIAIGVLSILLFSNFIKTRDTVYVFLVAFLVAVAIHSVIGWYEFFTRDYNFLTSAEKMTKYEAINHGIPLSTFGENEFAVFMYFGFFASFACMKGHKNSMVRILSGIVLINCTIMLILTTSRATKLGFIVALLFMIIIATRPGKYLVPIGVAGFACTAHKIIPMAGSYLSRALSSGSGSNAVRINLLRNGLVFLVETFGIGVGAGQIESWMQTRSIYPTIHSTSLGTVQIVNMHNWWGEILVAYGIVVFAAYLLFYIKLVYDMYKEYKTNQDPIALAFCCCLIGNIIACISSSSEMYAEWKWVFFALIIAYQGVLTINRPRLLNHEEVRSFK